MQRLVRRLSDRLGVIGFTGIVLLIVAAGLGTYAPPLARQSEEMRAAADRARELLQEARQQLERQPPSLERAEQLREWFPTSDGMTADLRLVFEAAHNHQVELAKGDYAFANATDASGLQRFEIMLPIRERYVTIKAFVAEVLKSLPHASLAELRIERSAASVEVLDVRVRLTLYYRAS
jgi:hypothetical protein